MTFRASLKPTSSLISLAVNFSPDKNSFLTALIFREELVSLSCELREWVIFGLPLHSICFQKLKYFMFLKAISCIYY